LDDSVNINGNTILITGGATGIGLALAEVLSEAGNEVLICGRRLGKLDEAKRKFPRLHVMQGDIADVDQRQALVDWATGDFPSLNMLVNNAGIQRQIDLTLGLTDILAGEDEIEINLRAPIRLTASLIPQLMNQEASAIINISSGLGFVPIAIMPIYCATKAAIHAYSLSLRHQLRKTAIKVFEIIPPTVDTELDRGARARRGQEHRGIPPDEVAQATLKALLADEYEAAIGRAQWLRMESRQEPEKAFQMINGA
jgi:uncharacterized oxidoreductase